MDIDDYTRRYAAQYAGEEWFEKVLVAARRNEVLATLGRHPHERVLEVGCGLEPLFAFVPTARAWTIVEPSHDFVVAARERARGEQRDVQVVEGFLEATAAELGARFDLVVVSSLLHEVEDPHALLRALRSVSQPHTVLHVNVPNVRSFHRLLALEMGLIADLFEQSDMERKFQRKTRFDLASLRALCESEGFAVLRAGTYFVKPFTHRQMERIVDEKVVDARVLDALGRMTKYMPDLGCETYVELRCR